jgi:hypothetical protein
VANNQSWLHGRIPIKTNKELSRNLQRIGENFSSKLALEKKKINTLNYT